jgi:recombination protein RecR
MPILPAPIQDLIGALERLPGIGPKTASRLAFFLLRAPQDLSQQLSGALVNIKSATGSCKLCANITLAGQELCDVCADPTRMDGTICVVEEPMDVLAIERTGGFHGRYHVLQGVLSPIEGIGPDDLTIRALIERVRSGEAREIILATNPSMEGDATALYLRQQLLPIGVRVTRLARGLPVGGDLEYADQNTLLRALAGRQEMTS